MCTEEIEIPFSWGTIAGKAWGHPDDLQVLVVHGIQDNAGSFDNLIPLLPNGFYYVCIDLPGHGKSSHLPKNFSFTILDYTEVVVKIIDHLKWKNCHYIGHSLGGQIGMLLSGAFPEKITKLILLDVLHLPVCSPNRTVKYFRNTYDNMLKLEERLSSRSMPHYNYNEAIRRVVESRMTGISWKGAETLIQRSLVKNDKGFHYSTDQRLKLLLPVYLDFGQQKDFIDNIKCPTLAVIADETYKMFGDIPFYKGTESYSIEFFHKLFDNKKNYKYVFVTGNHNVHIDFPKKVAPYVSKFLFTENSKL